MQNLSIGVNVVYEGSPSRILKVLLISLGMTIRPKSSTLLTIPVAFIYLSPFLQRTFLGPLPEGAGTANAVTEGGKTAYNHFTNYDTIICKDGRIILFSFVIVVY